MTVLARFAHERLARICESNNADLDHAIEVLKKVDRQFPGGLDGNKDIDGVNHSTVSYARSLCRDSRVEQAVWDFLTD